MIVLIAFILGIVLGAVGMYAAIRNRYVSAERNP